MPDNLSLREAAFAAQYVAKAGNGTQAAIAAGYAPKGAHVQASVLLKRPKVKRRIERLVRKHDITAERVLTRLDNLSAKAEEAGNYPAAVKAEQLLGHYLGMFVSQNVNVNVDITSQHIDAIRALAARRSKKNSGERPGDDARVIEGQATTAADNAALSSNVHYDNQAYSLSGKNSEQYQHVTDAEPHGDVTGPRSDALNADGDKT